VLTIDDSLTVRNFLERLLSRWGAEVEQAASGEEGLSKLHQPGVQYDLILLDLVLPDINGLTVLQRLRKHDDQSAVVILTGEGGVKSAIAAVRDGADGYIEKQALVQGDDYAEFFYGLEQAMEHRAGIVTKKQLDSIKADFYAMITHDLRSPMGTIIMGLDMVLNDEKEPLTPHQRHILMLVNEAAEKTMRLINDYLDYAKIDAGYLKLNRHPIDLREVARDSVRLARVQADAKQQTLHVELPDEPVVANADPERMKQVLDNLLSNAIKYTPEGGEIWLRLYQKGFEAVFEVEDNGIGIPPELLPTIFAKYHRVPGQSRRGIHGTGLGLLIVKEIVKEHGGEVDVHSEGVPGKGTKFVMRIPL